MAILQPKVISLDTSTLGLLAKNRGTDSKRVIEFLSTGDVIPFFTSTVINELFQHGNDEVIRDRADMLRRLPFVSYMRGCEGHAEVGWLLDLREAEFTVMCDFPECTASEVIGRLRGSIANQFCSGDEFCRRHFEEWMIMRELLGVASLKTPETAALSQFPLPGVDLERKAFKRGPSDRYRTSEEFVEHVSKQADWLIQKLKKDGDKKIKDPEGTALAFLRELCEDTVKILDAGGDPMERILAESGVDRARLPVDATIEDVSFENLFINHLKTHERRLNLPSGTLKRIVRQDQIPSWIVWREISREIRRLEKSEASSLNDKMLVPFALYLDAVEVDKRIRNCIRQSKSREPLMQSVERRVFRRRNLAELVVDIETVLEA